MIKLATMAVVLIFGEFFQPQSIIYLHRKLNYLINAYFQTLIPLLSYTKIILFMFEYEIHNKKRIYSSVFLSWIVRMSIYFSFSYLFFSRFSICSFNLFITPRISKFSLSFSLNFAANWSYNSYACVSS